MAALLSAFLAVLCNVLAHMPEVHQGVFSFVYLENDVASAATVTSVRTAVGNIQFASEGHVAVSALTGFNKYFCAIGKHTQYLLWCEKEPHTLSMEPFEIIR